MPSRRKGGWKWRKGGILLTKKDDKIEQERRNKRLKVADVERGKVEGGKK